MSQAFSDLANRQLARTWSLDVEETEAYTAMILRDLGTLEPRSNPMLTDTQICDDAAEWQEKRAAEADEDDASQHANAAHTLRALSRKLHAPELAPRDVYTVEFRGCRRGALGVAAGDVIERVTVEARYPGEARDAAWSALLTAGAYERGEHFSPVRVEKHPPKGSARDRGEHV